MAQTDKPRDIREACLQEALAIIETAGLENLSLREVARRLSVSHQAPYKHFASRDHILAAVVARAFDAFAQHLDAQPHTDDPLHDMRAMGLAYLSYAQAHPLQYRLMFGTPLPDPAEHPDMMRSAQHAFSLLRDCVVRHLQQQGQPTEAQADLDALYIWSSMHGLATIFQTSALDTLALPEPTLSAAVDHAMARLDIAMRGSTQQPAP